MKRILSILLVLSMLVCAACAVAESPAPGSRLGFEVLRAIGSEAENQVISPVSLAYALAMAAQGAEGETKQEILNALDGSAADVAGMTQALADAGQKLANAGFAAEDIEFSEEYIEALETLFAAEWFSGGRNPAGQINKWVEKHTDGLIDELVREDFPAHTQLVLLNAIAMDAKWAAPFLANATGEGVFHTADGEVTADFMHRQGRMEYGERDGVQMLRLHYLNAGEDGVSNLSMLIALPGAGGVSGVLDGLCAEGLAYFTFEEERRDVRLSMPKVDISADNCLNEVLMAMGVETAFTQAADFSGMSGETALCISGVYQNARLIMDEEGTKAAAATEVIMVDSAMPGEPPVAFTMDRPFVAVIADEVSGAVCFAAIVADPTAN